MHALVGLLPPEYSGSRSQKQKRLIIGCLTIFLRCTAVLPVNKVASGEGSSLRTHGTLLLVRHSSYGPTINRRLLADCTKLYTGVEIASGKGRA